MTRRRGTMVSNQEESTSTASAQSPSTCSLHVVVVAGLVRPFCVHGVSVASATTGCTLRSAQKTVREVVPPAQSFEPVFNDTRVCQGSSANTDNQQTGNVQAPQA